ncbi:MurR/RpiR family transcriptional regulator [Corynebacterium auris]|uniref:MurR/RpiR family transcriptional regulator n=1 Tax=Corynebacterium auris TaxID=44750 RepID=UPI0025B4082D|nr:MurR/RpiR family transcriptional regulator [Corynebacterium auris]WJY67648.1 HTH-type transcriptional regulator MurR [Corynebacterium auris]
MSSLQPKERAVAEAIAADPAAAVEMTAQQLADLVGVSRASVVRTAQSLGYAGFPQLRVALAQQVVGAPPGGISDGHESLIDTVRSNVAAFSRRLDDSFAALDEESLSRAVHLLDGADRVLVAANGLSAPLGFDLAQRLISAGRPAEFHADTMTQRIAAHSLGDGSVCFVFSGSGANRATLEVVSQARDSGATVIAATSFAPSPVAELADVILLVPPVDPSFQAELLYTSRAALMVLTEQLVEALHAERGERSAQWRATVMALVGESLEG